MPLVKKHVPLNTVNDFIAGVILGGLVFLYVGIKIGGGLAILRVAKVNHRNLRKQAGLPIRD